MTKIRQPQLLGGNLDTKYLGIGPLKVLVSTEGGLGFYQFLPAVLLVIQDYGAASQEIDEDKKIS